MNDIELCQELMTRAEEYQKRKEREFAIAELEKIKAEINDLQKAHHIWLIDQDVLIDECSEIIDNHISELKGSEKE